MKSKSLKSSILCLLKRKQNAVNYKRTKRWEYVRMIDLIVTQDTCINFKIGYENQNWKERIIQFQ